MNPNVMFGLSHREAEPKPHRCYPTHMKKFDDREGWFNQISLFEWIHDVAIAAIECEVVPSPICNGAHFIATT